MGSVLMDPPLPVTLSGTPVERVTSFKLLGVHVANDQVGSACQHNFIQGCIPSVLSKTTKASWCWNRRSTVLL